MSDPRNKNIFKMFSLIGIGERAGSGIENIYKVWDEQSWRKPEIIETFQPDRITMVLRTISLLPEKSLIFLKSIIGNEFNNLLKDEVVALVAAHQEEQITNARLQILINKNSIEANKILSMLIDKNLLEAEGQGRGTRYLLSDKFNLTPYIDDNSINNIQNSINSNANSIINNEDSINNDESLYDKLSDIAKLAINKKRLDVNTMDNIIVEMCRVKPMELKELSKLLNRNDVGLRNNYLNRLVKENRLKLLYPGQINHPKQAYLTNIDAES
ncbi:hypothetical protein JMF89_04010 [Clostridiaceae bacterium UIB06]|uniref:ATP-dependent DNA helicase RecG C-terminal domain-containing protein n=1 Tax=Clostridium thailandense TaxID=2794346 RepID=A0A949TTL6_9CLOT|nr:hypothetical protein [Clostridium thailandense]MBV7271651.1 hypothetical protein [Clostridium thailandense]MCH5136378.1 hypothetical protein [Clostridiaceae bacterium UIB06]